jgi:glycosyltransferase involved in cell wall biosynthesis
MKISVVIPTRSRDDMLARCLEALRPQIVTGQDEVIVSDDGVSSATRSMIEARFAFARWTAGPQRGPASNRNHGASLASGDFILFLDDDVEPYPVLLSSYRAAVTDHIDVYEGRTTCKQGLHSPLEQSPINETGGVLWSCNMMVRATFWRTSGGFDEDFPYPHLEDVAFRERLLANGVRLLFVPGAAVDHPPRPLAPPSVLARQQESYFLYMYRYKGRPPSLLEFANLFFRHRVREIYLYPASRDSFRALGAMFVEATHILGYWRGWDRKWRGVQKSQPL